MKKFLFVAALGLFGGFAADAAVVPVASGTIVCGYAASVRHYTVNALTGVKTFYGLYYYFNSVTDAHTYILEQYPPVPYPRTSGADVMCIDGGVVIIGPPGP